LLAPSIIRRLWARCVIGRSSATSPMCPPMGQPCGGAHVKPPWGMGRTFHWQYGLLSLGIEILSTYHH
jgi:hypothetical protein